MQNFHEGEGQRCPECGRRSWIVRDNTATCGHCEMPLARAVPARPMREMLRSTVSRTAQQPVRVPSSGLFFSRFSRTAEARRA